MTETSSSSNTDSEFQKPANADQDDVYGMGYDLYPERRRARPFNLENFLIKYQNREHIEQYKCERRLVKVIKQSELWLYCVVLEDVDSTFRSYRYIIRVAGPMVRIMLSSLEKAGWLVHWIKSKVLFCTVNLYSQQYVHFSVLSILEGILIASTVSLV